MARDQDDSFYLLLTICWVPHFIYICSLNTITLWGDYFHFIDEENETERVRKLPKASQLIKVLKTQVCLTSKWILKQ